MNYQIVVPMILTAVVAGAILALFYCKPKAKPQVKQCPHATTCKHPCKWKCEAYNG